MNMFKVKSNCSEQLRNLAARCRTLRCKHLRLCVILYIIAKDIKPVRFSLASRNVTAKKSLEAGAHRASGLLRLGGLHPWWKKADSKNNTLQKHISRAIFRSSFVLASSLRSWTFLAIKRYHDLSALVSLEGGLVPRGRLAKRAKSPGTSPGVTH
jgi:hypothetical protein